MKNGKNLSLLGKNYLSLSRLFNMLSIMFRLLKHSIPLRDIRVRKKCAFAVRSPGFSLFRKHFKAKYGRKADFNHMWVHDIDGPTKMRYEEIARRLMVKRNAEGNAGTQKQRARKEETGGKKSQ